MLDDKFHFKNVYKFPILHTSPFDHSMGPSTTGGVGEEKGPGGSQSLDTSMK